MSPVPFQTGAYLQLGLRFYAILGHSTDQFDRLIVYHVAVLERPRLTGFQAASESADEPLRGRLRRETSNGASRLWRGVRNLPEGTKNCAPL